MGPATVHHGTAYTVIPQLARFRAEVARQTPAIVNGEEVGSGSAAVRPRISALLFLALGVDARQSFSQPDTVDVVLVDDIARSCSN